MAGSGPNISALVRLKAGRKPNVGIRIGEG